MAQGIVSMLQRMRTRDYEVPEWLGLSRECVGLLWRLMEPDPDIRIGIQEVMAVSGLLRGGSGGFCKAVADACAADEGSNGRWPQRWVSLPGGSRFGAGAGAVGQVWGCNQRPRLMEQAPAKRGSAFRRSWR